MNKEQVRWITEQLENGVVVTNCSPDFMNGLVGQGYLGYTITLINERKKQTNVVLKVRNTRELIGTTTITMTVHRIFHYVAGGKEENIATDLIGREVFLTPLKARKVINSCYSITGILTLKKEPP